MATLYNPSIVRNNLIINLDAANSRSYDSRENLLTYSTDLSWNTNNTPTKTLNAAPAPDLSNTAIKLDLDAGYEGYYTTALTLTAGATYNFSIYVKYLSGKNILFFGCDTGNLATVNINMQTGVATARVGSPTNIVSTNVGDGWYRVSFCLIPPTTGSYAYVIYSEDATAVSCLVWNPQVEKSATANTAVSTTTTSVTRSTSVKDLSINSNNATLTNGPTYNSSNNGVFVFDGTDDYINGIHNAQLDITGDLTIECWFKITNTRSDWVRIFGKGDSINRTYGLWYNTGTNAFLYQRYGASGSAGLIYTGEIINLNKWYHLVGTSIGSNHSLYLNGVLVSTGTGLGPFYSSTSTYKVGYGEIHVYHLGEVGNCKIYNTGLSSTEVFKNYNAIKGRYGL